MKTIRLVIILILAAFLISGCASSSGVGKSGGGETITAPDKKTLPELSSIKSLPVPPKKLSGINHSASLSTSPALTETKGIYTLSPSVYTWKPSENLIDVYVYEKASGKYIACIKDCYQDAFWKGQWGNLTNVSSVWAKNDAIYLFSSSLYILVTKDADEIMMGYLAKTEFNNIYRNLDKLRWQPKGETTDYYIYSKKEKKFVTYVKDCWRQSFAAGLKGWNRTIKDSYRLINTKGQEFLFEASDYLICNAQGYVYADGWGVKGDFDNASVFGKPLVKKYDGVSVTLHPFRDLVHICVNLTDCPSIVRTYADTKEYNDELNIYFGEYKNHKAVQYIKNHLKSFEKDRLDIDRRLYAMINDNRAYMETEILKCGESFNFFEFYNLLKDFAEQTDFIKFFDAHKDYYINNVLKCGKDSIENVQKWSKSYLKMKSGYSYTINMQWSEWCDVSVDNKKITINLCFTKQPNDVGLAHEISHIAGNSVIMKLYESDLKPRFDIVYDQNKNTEAAYTYIDTLSYFCDSFVRATAGSYMYWAKQDPKEYLKSQKDIGFVPVPELYEKCNEFYSRSYNSLDDWYNELYRFFDSYLPKK